MNMTEQLAVAQQISTRTLKNTPTSPLLYLSSAEEGWEELVAQAFHEPMELEGWITPAIADISLVLFTGGAMHIEQRRANGPWKGMYIRQGDLILRPGVGSSYEVRWKCLSSVPTQTLHFRQTTGESPHQFVLRQRIQRAQCLLKERDMPLAHVALESGFANQSHLTQAFKRHLGLTPRAYRQDRSIRADF